MNRLEKSFFDKFIIKQFIQGMEENIMNRLEKSFEKYIIKHFKSYDVFVKKMSMVNDPGFPDLWVEIDDKKALLEIKVMIITKRDKKISPLFKKTQPPWYKKYLKESKSNNLFLLLKVFLAKDNKKLFYLIKIDDLFLKNIEYLTYFTIFQKTNCLLVTYRFFEIIKLLEYHLKNNKLKEKTE